MGQERVGKVAIITASALLIECLISLKRRCNWASSSWVMLGPGSLINGAISTEEMAVVLD